LYIDTTFIVVLTVWLHTSVSVAARDTCGAY